MTYYMGACSSYQNLANQLVEKCQAHGWAWDGSILSKDDLFIKIESQDTTRNNAPAGIILTGSTTGGDDFILHSSITRVRMGSPHQTKLSANFPALYHLFIFEGEIYLIMKFDYDKFFYLAFGKSTLLQKNQVQGTTSNGLWLSATACYFAHNNYGIDINTTGGGSGGAINSSAVAPFWNRYNWQRDWSNSLICHGLDDILWSSGNSRAWCSFEPLINRMPTNHFSDSPLLPYNIYLERPENKMSLICQFENARFLRIDNHEPEQIITLGYEKWMVFPCYRKNIAVRNAGSRVEHTGTFGWAIRYEG